MLALRLTFTAQPLALVLRFLLLCAATGVGLLLLVMLSHALERPERPVESAVRLLWCVVPLAVAAQLAAALARTEPHHGARAGLAAAGMGPARLRLLAAVTAGLPCALGSALVLVAAAVPGEPDGVGLPGTRSEVPLPGQPLPLPATLTLLSAAPLVAACAAAVAAGRASRDEARKRTHGEPRHESPRPLAGLPWGAALTLSGLALAAYGAGALSSDGGRPVRADALLSSPLLIGWLLAALGLVLAGPGLAHLCGRLLATGHPGPVRLLSGRGLQREAPYVGRPLGAVCALGAALLALVRVGGAGKGAAALPWPLVAAAVALIACAMAGTLLTALARTRRTREQVQEVLARLGASARLRRAVGLARAAALCAALLVPVVAAGLLAAVPLL